MLHHARHRRDRLGRVDALLDEQRRDEVVDRDAMLGDQAAQGRGAAQPAQPALGERHAERLLAELAQESLDQAVDRVRIGLDVDPQTPAPGGLARDRTDRDDRRRGAGPSAERRPDRASQKLSTVDDDVKVIASTAPDRIRARSSGATGAGSVRYTASTSTS